MILILVSTFRIRLPAANWSALSVTIDVQDIFSHANRESILRSRKPKNSTYIWKLPIVRKFMEKFSFNEFNEQRKVLLLGTVEHEFAFRMRLQELLMTRFKKKILQKY